MTRFAVWVFEPALDPGGYEGEFMVDAVDESAAWVAALNRASERWPDHHGLAVWRSTQEAPSVQGVLLDRKIARATS